MPQGIYVHTTLNLHDIQPRLPQLNSLWWTTSNGSVFLPSSTPASEHPLPTSSPALSAPPASSSDGSGSSPPSSSDPSSGAANGGGSLSRRTSTPTSASSPGQTLTPTTIITSSPVVITSASSAFTSFSQLTLTTNVPLGSAVPDMGGALANNHQPVCIGDGVDVQAVGLISTAILPSAVGLALWLLFAIIRPRFRQIYASREWFAPQGLRPEPLSDSLWAFLFPHVPLVPSLPTDDDDTEKTQSDPRAIPSDAELGQRVLWICLLIAAVWAFVGLAGALPLYLVDTPCLANSLPGGSFSGIYSTLQDLSVLRLLRLLDDGDFSTQLAEVLSSRAVEGGDISTNLRVRFIVLTVLVIVLAMLPALYKILKEFSKLVAYRNWWLSVYCDGLEMGWLNAQRAPGFVGWGEQKLKTFLLNNRLSSTLETTGGRIRSGNNAGIGAGYSSNRRAQAFGDDVRYPMNLEEKMSLEVNIHSLFSICDTQHLSLLIDERDYILNKLEIAETRYISSFRISTPEPSLLSDPPIPRQAPPPEDGDDIKRQISRPQALAGYRHRHRSRRQQNHGQDPSSSVSGAPTSYVAPQQYYKLRGVRGLSGGRVASDSEHEGSAFGDTIQSRLVGTRFQEVNRDSVAYGKLPIGSRMALDDSGELQPVMDSPEPLVDSDIPRHHILDPSSGNEADVETTPLTSSVTRSSKGRSRLSETDEPNYPNDMESNRANHASPVTFASDDISPEEDILGVVRRSTKDLPSERRDTFPMRNRTGGAEPNSQLPPHLRLQPQGPFVRPVSGLDHDDLGEVYSDIGQWRTKLKTINAEIADAQNAALNDIAEGVRLKGWLITGRGIRFLPGIEMIEGRSKEDIRWTELQQENGTWNKTMFWTVVVMISMFLGAALIAVSALAVADAPDVAFYLAFFRPIANAEIVSSGLAITIVPALAATLFIFVALAFVQYTAQLDGSVSITASRLTAFKATFFILAFISTVWLLAAGSLIFSLRAFDTSNERALTVANGSVYMSAFFLTLVINVAIIAPALLLLQPRRLLNVLHEERSAVTPRQRFRAVYPRSYDPSYALGCTTLAVIFAATFSLIFPLIGPAVVLLLALTMIAHRFLVGYVYGRTEAATGGLTQLWLLRRLATIVTFQSILLGLIYLTRRLFIEGGVLVGVGVFAIFLVEIYTTYKMRLPSRKTLHEETHQALQIFEETAHAKRRIIDEEETSDQLNVTPRPVYHRGSFASVLEMMSITLAVTPSNSQSRAAIPLETEFLDDLVATERAARTHPDAAPHLPPLSFADHAEEMVSVLYANEVLAPPPMIWLPNDSAGIARSEAYDLEHYHDLRTTLDVKTSDDVIPRRRSSSSRRP